MLVLLKFVLLIFYYQYQLLKEKLIEHQGDYRELIFGLRKNLMKIKVGEKLPNSEYKNYVKSIL